MSKSHRKQSKQKVKMAEVCDRHALYEDAVQSVDSEMDFVEETYRRLRKRRPLTIREDFCGTANASCEWVRRGRDRQAWGIDLDPEVLDWGRKHHVEKLGPNVRKALHLIEGDVLSTATPPVDMVLAMNFSYWIFRDRKSMRQYFETVRSHLKADGLFFMDTFGGYDAFRELREKRDCTGFTYTWDQADYDPVSGRITCHIHFSFPDGSRLRNAFTYHWRLWTLPELQELLQEAGFSRSTVYWQGTDEDGEGDGNFEPCERGDADPAWVAYIVAEK